MAEANSLAVEAFWLEIIKRDWGAARSRLSSEFKVDWPHTRERIAGADHYITLTSHWPEPWTMEVLSVRQAHDGHVYSELFARTDSVASFCCAIFRVHEGKILGGVEYWLDSDQERPEWRKEYTTLY